MKENQESSPQFENANLPLAMNRQQAAVFELLRGLATNREKFHEWYQGAIQVLSSKSPDRIAQAAHSIRELCDRLPKRIANIPEFKSPISAAKPFGSQFLEIKKCFYPDIWNGKLINQPLNEALNHFEKIFSEPSRTKRFGQALIATDPQTELLSKDTRRERDKAFEQIVSFFQNVTHHNRYPSEADFRKQLELFESLLLNYLTPCTAAQQKELLELIAGPTDSKAMDRVRELTFHKAANLSFFFSKLDNPNWLPLLDQHGYFENLPEPEPTENGRIMYRHHLPLMVLIRLAGIVPEAVTEILVKLRLPDNPNVGDQVLQCMAKIRDPLCIPRLRPVIAQLSVNPSRTSWLWIQELLKTWMELDAFLDVIAITEIYLSAAVNLSFNEYPDHSNSWLTKQIDEKVLEPLTSKYPIEVANVVFKTLCQWAKRERQKYNSLKNDSVSMYWLEDFKNPPQHHRELEGTLASRLFKAAEQIYRGADDSKIAELDQLLHTDPSNLFARLRWQLYADFPAHSLDRARRDVIAQIPQMNRATCPHNYEFAQMLEAHARFHGSTFLSPNEVETFFDVIFSGPVDVKGEPLEEYKPHFRRKQLQPISSLLQGEQLASYRALCSGEREIESENYKSFRSGGGARFIEHVPPKEADKLSSMPAPQLWNFLNNWQPNQDRRTGSEWWIEEDVDALATKFSELVESEPERFSPLDKWWEYLRRPAFFYKFLERVSHRIEKKPAQGEPLPSPPTEEEWANWFGVATWTTLQRPIVATGDNKELDWTWARTVVARFLQVAIHSNHQLPETCLPILEKLLRDLIQEEDSRLDGRESNDMGDWYTTAINSVRGGAFEALLELALKQKNAGNKIDSWIFDIIRTRLQIPSETPAIFAMLGAKLRLLIHLFGSEFKESPELLFPVDRPLHQRAAIVAHFSYDNPWVPVIKTFPDLFNLALKILEEMRAEGKDDEAKQNRRDFGSRLGTHIACYYWSGSFSNDSGETALDRFFAVATKSARALLISQIASIWDKHSEEKSDEKVIARVMRIWERRFALIAKNHEASNSEFDSELTESIDWLNCECFPFEWRFTYAKQAIELLKKAPRSHRFFEAISKFGIMPDRSEAMLQLFRALLQRPSDELRWSIQFKELAPVISQGLVGDNSNIKRLAEECRDLLLKMGFSEFLDLG